MVKNYVVKFTPKYKDSGYKTIIIKPYLETIKWNKTRAIAEMKFSNNDINRATGLKLKETHKGSVILER